MSRSLEQRLADLLQIDTRPGTKVTGFELSVHVGQLPTLKVFHHVSDASEPGERFFELRDVTPPPAAPFDLDRAVAAAESALQQHIEHLTRCTRASVKSLMRDGVGLRDHCQYQYDEEPKHGV